MYLFGFVFIMLSLLGMMTQIFVMQSSRIYSGQKAMAQIMLSWHSAAVGTARSEDITNATLPCTPTPTYVSLTSCTFSMDLPDGYNDTDFKWPTVYYRDGSLAYVITYVEATSGNEAITQPNIGISSTELMRQLGQLNNLSLASYGYVELNGTDHILKTQFLSDDITEESYYPVYSIVPENAVALVSPL